MDKMITKIIEPQIVRMTYKLRIKQKQAQKKNFQK